MPWSLLKDDDGHVDRAQHTELIGLFEESILALQECDRAVALVCDGLYLDLSSAHGDRRGGTAGVMEMVVGEQEMRRCLLRAKWGVDDS